MRFRPVLVSIAALGLLASCGDAEVQDSASSSTTTPSGSTTPAVSTTAVPALPKPEVKLPATLPTTLVITDLKEGTGPAAANGDTIVVRYIGVRSVDGTEFDSDYDDGSTFPLTLGAKQVIDGWDQGLVGVKQGGRRQLDVPPDLAYGDNPQGDIIQPGDALTFVIDIVAVLPKSDPADAPAVSVAPAANQPTQTMSDLVVGTGAEIKPGQTVAVHLIAFSAKDGAKINSTWDEGTPVTFVPGTGQIIPGIEKAVEGMKVGGRRQVTIPFADAFGPDGNPNLGLPASTDLIVIVDLVAVY